MPSTSKELDQTKARHPQQSAGGGVGQVTSAADTKLAVARLIDFLETGIAPQGLFASDLFLDVSLPQWRIQASTAEDGIAVRTSGHPCPGRVHVERVSQTNGGFVIEFEERWQEGGQSWYCREMIRADVIGDTIVDMSVYCTGDWDEERQLEHAATVRLIRP